MKSTTTLAFMNATICIFNWVFYAFRYLFLKGNATYFHTRLHRFSSFYRQLWFRCQQAEMVHIISQQEQPNFMGRVHLSNTILSICTDLFFGWLLVAFLCKDAFVSRLLSNFMVRISSVIRYEN